MKKQELIKNFKMRNIDVEYFDDLKSAKEKILSLISKNLSVE